MIDLEVSDLELYFGDDYIVNDKIIIHQPTIGELIKCEKDYFGVVYALCAIPSDMKSQLFDMGLDWNVVEDFQLFCMLAPTLSQDRTSILFGDLDFSAMKVYPHPRIDDEIVLADKQAGMLIDRMIYTKIVSYLRKLHGLTPKVEKTKSKTVKKWLIEEDRNKIKNSQNKPFKSYLLPLISSVKVKQGYTKDYVRNMGLRELFDDVARLQIIHNADHLLSGIYAGTIDMKKIDKKEINWMKEL